MESGSVATWVGAVLGVANFLIFLFTSRPVFSFSTTSTNDKKEIAIDIFNNSPHPLFIRNIKVFPKYEIRRGTENKSLRQTIEDAVELPPGAIRPFFVEREALQSVIIGTYVPRFWHIIIVFWYRGGFSFPISIKILTPRLASEIIQARSSSNAK